MLLPRLPDSFLDFAEEKVHPAVSPPPISFSHLAQFTPDRRSPGSREHVDRPLLRGTSADPSRISPHSSRTIDVSSLTSRIDRERSVYRACPTGALLFGGDVFIESWGARPERARLSPSPSGEVKNKQRRERNPAALPSRSFTLSHPQPLRSSCLSFERSRTLGSPLNSKRRSALPPELPRSGGSRTESKSKTSEGGPRHPPPKSLRIDKGGREKGNRI